ncbi:MAG: PspA/IM30 family protein [bacterium]
MSTLTRIKQIITSNINHLIEKAEDPEKIVKQLLREMDENIINLRMEVAKAIATEKRLGRRVEEVKDIIHTWQENIEKAVRDGNDNLAREAISRRLTEENQLVQLEKQHEKALSASQEIKKHLQTLENKIQEVRRKKEILIARKKSAQAQKSVIGISDKFHHISRRADILLDGVTDDGELLLKSMNEEVLILEGEVEAMNEIKNISPSLNETFEGLKKQEHIERILREVKNKITREE